MSIKHIGKHISKLITPNMQIQRVTHTLQSYSNNDWKQYVDPDIDSNVYTRTKVYEDGKINMYVSTWKPGYISTIHSHSLGGCWFRILKGELIERQYDPETYFMSRFSVLTPINTVYIHDSIALHSVENRNIINAVSLHVYPKKM